MSISSGHRLALIAILQICLLTQLSTGALVRSKRVVPSSVCYGDLGCFSTGGNFRNLKIRPIQPLPWSPEFINLTFWLFTRSNILNSSVIRYNDSDSVNGSKFNPKKPTKIICHGWTFIRQLRQDDIARAMKMKNALLSFGDYNVIQLDWDMSSRAEYTQSVSNTRVVGAIIARMVMWLEREFGANRADFHIIGHSLGAHVAGYAGARLRESEARQLGRITGLDAAGIYFENTHPEVRLDPTDARFVDAIHTDAGFLRPGINQPVGHVDFYPNGGSNQPGCNLREIYDTCIINAVSCDHIRVTDLFTATALNPGGDYQAYECSDYTKFKAGRCLRCGTAGCPQLGIRASEWNPNGRTNVRVWSDTQATAPFNLHHYSVTVKLASSGFRNVRGDLSVALVSENGQTTSAQTLLSDGIMQPGLNVYGLVTANFSSLRVANFYTSSDNITASRFVRVQSVHMHDGYSKYKYIGYNRHT